MIMMKNFAFAMGAIFPGILLFSGCTMQRSPSLLSGGGSTVDVNQKVLSEVPFAYDIAMDTISYNSCVGSGLNSGGHLHGLKIGANEGFVDSTNTGAVKAGLKLRSEFLQYVATNVEPTYPNTTVVPSQIQYLLQNSDSNKDAMIQIAVRNKSNLTVVQDVIDQSKVLNSYSLSRDGLYKNAILSTEPILSAITNNVKFGEQKTVASEGPRIYNIGTSGQPEALEGSLGYSAAFDETFQAQAGVDDGTGYGEQYSDIVRNKFNNTEYLLSVTFGNMSQQASSDSTSSFGLNSPRREKDSPLNKAFGKSYELGFTSKAAGIPSQRRNILNRVVEKDLNTGNATAGASWSCENYVIMKTNQWNNKKASEPACSEVTAKDLETATLGPILKARIQRIRRHYPEADWGVGVLIRENTVYNAATRLQQPICLVNKVVDCYLDTKIAVGNTVDVGVNYTAAQDANTSECYLSRYSQMGVSYIGNKTGDDARILGRCPQYASICVRTSTSY